jgi:hypothetical protein
MVADFTNQGLQNSTNLESEQELEQEPLTPIETRKEVAKIAVNVH